ncbi:MAG: hypothetical protein APG12_00024 [Candidatus Methanofastidiosum methylothiophilum]|uniref:Uncharacterized protein n=1 Tax=Candidatus Methanofastidiosum methylothiophilum TaxID=1705564 RepID=A0A150J2B0_9EURY|nr:MAG: hypothetical protein APG11_00025 [Candidatus Methanofastidiosum methylthiophilus]KYC51363.1 MAG: hypothetical protein APG12_00024 [Candidatus Methanofastidiosum methylthiophilus]
MEYKELIKEIDSLAIGEKKDIYETHFGEILFVYRPHEVTKNLKREYEVNKNFQIYLKEYNKKEFRPNHLRLLIDINLKLRSNSEERNNLLKAFDDIYYGKCPEIISESLSESLFSMRINYLECNLYLAQLFMAEQDINYKGSKYDPCRLFFQGWIREVLMGTREIDALCWSVTKYQAPSIRFTCQDNKNHKKYNSNRKELWYLEDNQNCQQKLE